VSQLTTLAFHDLALAQFPELREEFEDHRGLPHLQMGAFARLVEEAKGRADWETYAQAAALADRLWRDADFALRNALNVSFLELIDFEGPHGPRAWMLLSARLQRAWQAMEAYSVWLHTGAKGEPPAEADVQ
jgi:hypothetical protein